MCVITNIPKFNQKCSSIKKKKKKEIISLEILKPFVKLKLELHKVCLIILSIPEKGTFHGISFQKLPYLRQNYSVNYI